MPINGKWADLVVILDDPINPLISESHKRHIMKPNLITELGVDYIYCHHVTEIVTKIDRSVTHKDITQYPITDRIQLSAA